MNYSNAFSTAIRALSRNKMRSGLTSIGIIIGVFSVIVMFGMGTSARLAIKEKLTSFGTNTIWIVDDHNPITERDAHELRKLPIVKFVSLILPYSAPIRRKQFHYNGGVWGVDRDYFKIMKRYAQEGRLFSKKDQFQLSKVAVIGTKNAKRLFKGQNPIGHTITVGSLPVTVVGILNEMGTSMTGHDFDDVVYLPYTTLNSRLLSNTPYHWLYAASGDELQIDSAKLAVENYFRKKLELKETDKLPFMIYTSQEKLKMANDISAAMVVLLAGIASISLFVGGVGIMNIMLVSVTERTREIGIRMAIGARKKDIMIQFLIESITLSVLGGLIGITSGLMVYFAITWFVKWPFIISFPAIIVSFLFASLVGVFFGYYPSKKASNLKPIEALKYE